MGTKPTSEQSHSREDRPPVAGSSGMLLRSHTTTTTCPVCCSKPCTCTPLGSSAASLQELCGGRRGKQKRQLLENPSSSGAQPRRQLFKEEPPGDVTAIAGPSRPRTPTPEPKWLRNTCSVCRKTFASPGKLVQHMYSHTGERPFICQQCHKAFSSKFKLVRHVLIHSDQRHYICLVCERTFHRKDHLKNHAKIHSPVKRRFRCDRENCGKEYCSVLSFRKHTAVHSAEEGNLQCKMCGKDFATKEDVIFHLKVHAGSRSIKTPADRKYRCDHCDRSFFTGKDVRRHMVVHTGRRDFLCQFCPQRFGRKDHLVRHIKKSHSTTKKKGRKDAKTKSVRSILQETGRFIESVSEERPAVEAGSSQTPQLYKEESETYEIILPPTEHMIFEPEFAGLPTTYEPNTSVKPDPDPDYETLNLPEFINLMPSSTGVMQIETLPDLPLQGPDDQYSEQSQDMLSFITPETTAADTGTAELQHQLLLASYLSNPESPPNTTPLPRFNQAFPP